METCRRLMGGSGFFIYLDGRAFDLETVSGLRVG